MDYKILSIKRNDYKSWLLHKHYAHRIPSISHAFGLYNLDNTLQGVLTIGKPASNSLCFGICGKKNSIYVYELNRLCVNDNLEKNTLSRFVSNCLKLLPNMILVSYADSAMGHHGYIYQATNWIYTGMTKERTDIGSGDNKHSRHYDKAIDYSKNRKFRSSKYRYLYFVGDKKQKRQWYTDLNYKILTYPKGDNKKYDTSYRPKTQELLF